jgi:transposase
LEAWVKEDRAMAMGKRDRAGQDDFWVPTASLPPAPAHPFYVQVNTLLDDRGFDRFVEDICRRFYAEKMGRPSLPPAVYFRLLLIGYFEGIDSERGIAWRVADSLGLRRFLGYKLTDDTPDHSTISRNRRLIDLETHQQVFTWMLGVLADSGLLRSKTVGIDATTLEANAAMRSIVRKETGEAYQDFLQRLAKESGIETPTREELAKLDKTRKNKASNDDWENPNDPDAKITKMKDGRTHLAHKAEHAVDMDSGAILAVTLQPADRGDTTSIGETLEQAGESIVSVVAAGTDQVSEVALSEIVADKGYHSNAVVTEHHRPGVRTYIAEPDRGRRDWEGKTAERDAVYANRRRIRGRRGKRLMRKRGELIERSFAHCYDTGGMRRTHLRQHENILKRLLIHVAGFNLSLVMRKVFGLGTARGLQGLVARVVHTLARLRWLLQAAVRHLRLTAALGAESVAITLAA